MKAYTISLFCFLFFIPYIYSGNDSTITRKEYFITRTAKSPHIDGISNDDVWKTANILGDLTQESPNYNKPVTQRTEVKMVYDNTAIYISAILYDTAPDSIAHQLGNRDDNVNADNFRVVFDIN